MSKFYERVLSESCVNVCELLIDNLSKHPDKIAISYPKDLFNSKFDTLTTRELEQLCSALAWAMKSQGVGPGDKVVMFVKPKLEFAALTFALFRMGAVPVFIDPGMGFKNLLKCVESVNARVLIAEPIVHVIRKLKPKAFKSIEVFFSLSKNHFFAATGLLKLAKNHKKSFPVYHASENEMAAILFTSGGTGAPKGVVYTHKIFLEQTKMLGEMFSLTPKDVDLPGFPLFSLFTVGLGMESSIPLMNPARPAKVDAAKLIHSINARSATFVAGSPAIWKRVVDFCEEKNLVLSSVKYLVMFGAPVRVDLHERLTKILPNGTTYTPYGATECLPIATTSGKYILENVREHILSGAGVYLGHPANGVDIKIIARVDEQIDDFSKAKILNCGEVGEMLIQSSTVTPSYYQLQEKTKLAKIYDGNTIYHRMGDVGYLDSEGALWFLGRKNHVVCANDRVYYPVSVEAAFNKHPEVEKSALIEYKSSAAIVIQRKDGLCDWKSLPKFKAQLLELAASSKHCHDIEDIFLHPHLPVDGRHNIKIQREKLTVWANNFI